VRLDLVGASAWLLVTVTLGACNEAEPAWVAEVEAAHASADGAQSESERNEASSRLETAYLEVPVSDDPTLTWVRQDLCVRIGDSALRRGDPEAALLWAERCLGIAKARNVARADLLRVKGEALEGLGKKEQAARALHEALQVNQGLMERALRGEPLEDGSP
jgi:tetratricopeptide (TPR) repeat protein